MKCPLCDTDIPHSFDDLVDHLDRDHELFTEGPHLACVCGEKFRYYFHGEFSLRNHLQSLGDQLEAHLMLGVLAR